MISLFRLPDVILLLSMPVHQLYQYHYLENIWWAARLQCSAERTSPNKYEMTAN